MRIGFFNSSLPSPGRKPGGVDVHVNRLANRLAERGHELTMFSYSPAPEGASYRHVELSPARLAHDRLGRLVAVPVRLNRLPTKGLDVLHLHGDDWFYVARRLPTVRTFYGSSLQEARHATRMRRRASQLSTYLLELLASRLATTTYGLLPGQGTEFRVTGHLPCAVDVPAQAPPKEEGPPSILFVGTWIGRKRGSLLHQAFVETVRPQVPEAELHMVSDHCEPAEGVTWWQRPSDEELTELYRRATVFCLPSSYEGFGIPYVEAMAQGTPVVTTPNEGADYIVGQEHGLVTGEDDLGASLVRVLTDAELRDRLASAARRRAADFTWDVVLDAHERAYEDAIERWSGGGRNGGRHRDPR